jgi:hypothetical protein
MEKGLVVDCMYLVYEHAAINDHSNVSRDFGHLTRYNIVLKVSVAASSEKSNLRSCDSGAVLKPTELQQLRSIIYYDACLTII